MIYPPYRFGRRAEATHWVASVFVMHTNFYVDGFNLYYRALRGTGFRWLDLRTLAETLFPHDAIGTVHYFTALLTRRPNDPTQPQRQQAYLRALATLPDLEIHYGTFRSGTRWAAPTQNPSRTIEVFHTEEKGSDVNLAVQLMADAFNGKCEQAVVVSSDADFVNAMWYVRQELGLRVALVHPDRKRRPPKQLSDAATYIKHLRASHLTKSQFPAQITDARGTFSKPPGW